MIVKIKHVLTCWTMHLDKKNTPAKHVDKLPINHRLNYEYIMYVYFTIQLHIHKIYIIFYV